MAKYNHIVDRNIIEWTSFGKYHNEPARKTLIKDISDAHLLKIIEWIRADKCRFYSADLLQLMKDESKFRAKNYIFVPETY